MSMSILLVDDHDANREVLRRRLERRGYAVVEATDGAEAVKKFCDAPPHYVIMDISMPNVSGIEALEQIRASGKGEGVPVVALTAHAMESMRQKCEECGFDGFLTKPIEFDRLVASIETLAGKPA